MQLDLLGRLPSEDLGHDFAFVRLDDDPIAAPHLLGGQRIVFGF